MNNQLEEDRKYRRKPSPTQKFCRKASPLTVPSNLYKNHSEDFGSYVIHP